MEPRLGTSTITTDADASEMRTVLAYEFVDIEVWSPDVNRSGPNSATPKGIQVRQLPSPGRS